MSHYLKKGTQCIDLLKASTKGEPAQSDVCGVFSVGQLSSRHGTYSILAYSRVSSEKMFRI